MTLYEMSTVAHEFPFKPNIDNSL